MPPRIGAATRDNGVDAHRRAPAAQNQVAADRFLSKAITRISIDKPQSLRSNRKRNYSAKSEETH
jgi:hypothetical protein